MTEQKYLALQLQTAGDSAMPDVLQMLRASKLAELCYAYKIRTKSEGKLIEKLQRKQQSKPEYSLKDITDVVGLRLVALFRAEMVDIFEGMLSAITHANGVNPNPLFKGQPQEVIIYKGTNAFDDLPPRLRDIAGRLCPGLTVREENSKEGYSSVHLVTRLTATAKGFDTDGYKIPIEIQIRSVFEDAWGEIDHKYGYVIRSGKDAGKPISNPEFVLAHLKVLKRFSDACMEYADAIRTEAVGVPPSLLATKKVVSVESDKDILERFAALNVPTECIDKYRTARDLKDEAAKMMDINPEEARREYLNSAELFRELAQSLEPSDNALRSSSGGELFYYYLRMNEALCLMSTNERDQVVAALGIYQGLEGTYGNFALLKMRYGQALGKLGYVDEALTKLRDAGAITEMVAAEFNNRPSKEWPDHLPHVDYEHLICRQPKLLGYHTWLKLRTLTTADSDQKALLFKQAYDVTKQGLLAVEHDSEQKLSLHNNLLYYALGQLTRTTTGTTDARELKDVVVEHLSYIEKNVLDRSRLDIPKADTMMKAYAVLGRRHEAAQMAEALTSKCLNHPGAELDAKEVLELVRVANDVVHGKDIGLVD